MSRNPTYIINPNRDPNEPYKVSPDKDGLDPERRKRIEEIKQNMHSPYTDEVKEVWDE